MTMSNNVHSPILAARAGMRHVTEKCATQPNKVNGHSITIFFLP